MSSDVEGIELRFAKSGCHCVDDNPLKSHSAQYVLPVRLARGELRFTDLFEDLRKTNDEVARLARRTSVLQDTGEFEDLFPNFYAGEITLTLKDGKKICERSDIARGYPEAALSAGEIEAKFDQLVGAVAPPERRAALRQAAASVFEADNLDGLAGLLAEPAVTQ
jgi:hypothetical protein